MSVQCRASKHLRIGIFNNLVCLFCVLIHLLCVQFNRLGQGGNNVL